MLIATLVNVLALLQTPAPAPKITFVEGFESGTNTGGWSFFGNPANSVEVIEAWLAAEGVTRAHVRFYSDHASDAPVLDWADEPVAVNPHDRLARLAKERGWPVEDWG